ncbi:CBS domain-containing protein, partial [Pseudomonas aeruginosa]|uniref:CBS domain-containing protein n=1 Tax=Pseudomonas aeruginosa TaxID=287 RepID=UPI0032B355CB
REAIRAALLESSYSRLPLVRDGRVEEPLGYVHKKELLKERVEEPLGYVHKKELLKELLAGAHSILIEVFNQVARKRRKKSLQGHRPLRARTAHAVLRLLGGQRLEADEVGEEVADLFEEGDDQVVFDRRERVMISGVLQLAEKPIRSLMTVRAEVDCIDLDSGREAIRAALLESSYSRLPLVRDGRVEEPLGYVHKKELLKERVEEPLGYVHKKELLKELLAGAQPDLESLARQPLNLLQDCSIL